MPKNNKKKGNQQQQQPPQQKQSAPSSPAAQSKPSAAAAAAATRANASSRGSSPLLDEQQHQDSRMQMFIASATTAAVSSSALESFPGVSPTTRALRSVCTAPDELSKLLIHAESDDSLYGKSPPMGGNSPPNQDGNINRSNSSVLAAAFLLSQQQSRTPTMKSQQQQQQQPPQEQTTPPDLEAVSGGVNKKNIDALLLSRNKSFDLGSGAKLNLLATASTPPAKLQGSKNTNSSSNNIGNNHHHNSLFAQHQSHHDEDAFDDDQDENVCSFPVKGSFVPLLALPQNPRNSNRRGGGEKSSGTTTDPFDLDLHPAGTDAASRMNTLLRLVGGLVLVRRIQWHNVLLWVASYVYIPLIAMLCVATANALLAVGAHAILPVIEYTNVADTLIDGVDGVTAGGGAAAAGAAVYSFFVHLVDSSTNSSSNNNSSGGSIVGGAGSEEDIATYGALIGVLLASSASLLIVVGTAVLGYKSCSMCADAFLDSARIVVDQRSGLTLYLFSLYSDIVRIFHLGWRWVALFTTVLVGIPSALLISIARGSCCQAVASRPAFTAALAALMLEVIWLIFQIVRFLLRMTKAQKTAPSSAVDDDSRNSSRDPSPGRSSSPSSASRKAKTDQLADQLLVWWSRKIVKMRKRNFFLLFITACGVTMGSGLLNGVIALAEGLLYASALHLAAHIAARTTLFLRSVRVALRTLTNNAAALIAALVVMPLLLCVGIINVYRFGLALSVIQLPVLVLALCSIASHAQDRRDQHEKDRKARQHMMPTMPSQARSSSPAATARDGGGAVGPGAEDASMKNLFSDLSFILWRVLLMNPRSSFSYGIHWKHARYVRVVLRVIITVFAFACTAVSTWTAMQSIQFRFSNYQSKLVTVTELPGGGLRTYTDSFSLELMPLDAPEASPLEQLSNSTAQQDAQSNRRSRHYRGMCQRRWWLANGEDSLEATRGEGEGDDDDDDDDGGETAAAGARQRKDEEEIYELSWMDAAFFSVLSYAAPIDKEQSQKKLFDFYRMHRVGAQGWQPTNPMHHVWDPLRAELRMSSSSADGGGGVLTAAERVEAKELMRWSRLHMAQSLRTPFLHFMRSRISTTNKKKRTKTGDDESSSSGGNTNQETTIEDSIYVMRGTELALAADLFQNMIIFADVFLVEQLAYFVPGVGLLPLEFVRDIIGATNGLAAPPETLYHHSHLRRYMRAHQLVGIAKKRRIERASPEKRFRMNQMSAGHSLGGVASSLAAPPLHIPAVAISAPGTFFLSSKFGVDALETESFVSNLVPSRDIIPLIGSLNGEIFNVACEHESSLLCHSVQLTLHRLMTHCSAHRKLLKVRTSYEVRVSEVTMWLQGLNKYFEALLGIQLKF